MNSLAVPPVLLLLAKAALVIILVGLAVVAGWFLDRNNWPNDGSH
jgi:uncharacterized membrane protein